MSLYSGIIITFVGIALLAIIIRKWSGSRGKITIDVAQKSIYRPSEIIKGNIIVDLKKITHANKLEIALLAEKRIPNASQMNADNKAPQSRIVRVYEFVLPIAGEDDYLKGQYPFELLVPMNDSAADEISDGLKIIKQVLSFWQTTNPIQWYLRASLDIPGVLDLSNMIQIQVFHE